MSTKVFVGNLSFKTRESELAHAFSQAGAVVKNSNIITRGPRSLGYGFVEFNTEEDAVKAVTAMNKKTIDGREINVELAKPRVEPQAATTPAQQSVPRTQNQERPFNPRGAQSRGPINNQRGGLSQGRGQQVITSPTSGNQGGQNFNPSGQNNYNQGGFNRGFRRNFRRGRGRGRGGYGRPPRTGSLQQTTSNNVVPIQQQPEVPRTPSSTTLFVANLPFSVNNDQLTDTFKEFNPVKAHVVVKRNQRSKGFGFVEFKNAEDQQKALQAMDKKEVAGRALIVKVALTENRPEGEKPVETPVAVTTPAATTEKKETPVSVPVAVTKN